MAAGTWAAVRAQQEGLPAGPGAAPPPTDERHYSYAIGLDLGTTFAQDDLKLDVDSLVAGIKDGLAGAEPKFNDQLCGVAMQRLNAMKMAVLAKRNREFLAENAKAEGVETTRSGLQIKVLKKGDGPTPGPTDAVQVHYRGQLIDGTVFDESYGGEPASLDVDRVIPGWTEALSRMKVGDKWQLTIPAELAYRDQGAGDVIPPHATLIFEIELLGVQGK
jgi:FKBP-type peptidyl-prolyl cis-trans isomerase FklB